MRLKELFAHYQFEFLEEEGVYIKNIYNAQAPSKSGFPCASHAVGIYCKSPKSFSRFHQLEHDELWHYYEGDSFSLHLLYPNGEYQHVRMGKNVATGECLQFLVPAGTWQAGEMERGEFSLFGCTMAPAFDLSIFRFRNQEELKKNYPRQVNLIDKF